MGDHWPAFLAKAGLVEAADGFALQESGCAQNLVDGDDARAADADHINVGGGGGAARSEEHTSELQSLMRSSYAVFCLKKKNTQCNTTMCDYAQRIKISR